MLVFALYQPFFSLLYIITLKHQLKLSIKPLAAIQGSLLHQLHHKHCPKLRTSKQKSDEINHRSNVYFQLTFRIALSLSFNSLANSRCLSSSISSLRKSKTAFFNVGKFNSSRCSLSKFGLLT